MDGLKRLKRPPQADTDGQVRQTAARQATKVVPETIFRIGTKFEKIEIKTKVRFLFVSGRKEAEAKEDLDRGNVWISLTPEFVLVWTKALPLRRRTTHTLTHTHTHTHKHSLFLSPTTASSASAAVALQKCADMKINSPTSLRSHPWRLSSSDVIAQLGRLGTRFGYWRV